MNVLQADCRGEHGDSAAAIIVTVYDTEQCYVAFMTVGVSPCVVNVDSTSDRSLVQLWTRNRPPSPKLHAVSDEYAPLYLLLSDNEKTITIIKV